VKCVVEVGSGAVTYIRNLINIGSDIQKFIWWDSQTIWRSHKPTFISLKIRKVG
jgi:hypothetical protein